MTEATTETPELAKPLRIALARFRVLATIVGVGLLILVLVAVPLNHLADQPMLSAIVGPLHGFLYMAYLAVAIDLAIRSKWSILGTVLVLLAGTIPLMSFVGERVVTARVRAGRRL